MFHLLDGLKPSYRRIIWTGLEYPDKMVKVATLAGVCGGKYSPHSPDSLPAVVSEMVRAGIFVGQGSHGSPSIYKPLSIDPAASRYIEAKLDPDFRKMISKLIPLVEFKESELDSMYKEPLYIPSPLPISMTYNSLGLGVGIRTKTPDFSMKSMLEAYKADDYNLLKSNSSLNIVNSDLKGIWTKGYGTVCYEFSLDDHVLDKTKGVLLHGDARFVQLSKLTPALMCTKSNPKDEDLGWIDKGLVEMIDLSSKKNGNRIFFRPKKGQRGSDKITVGMIKKELNKCRYHSEKYSLARTDGETSTVIPLKEWIHETYTNYSSLVDKYKKKRLDELKVKELVIKNSEVIAKEIMSNPKIKREELETKLNLPKEVISEALKKSISSLLKTNRDKDLQDVKKDKAQTKALQPKDFYEDFINR